MDASGLAKLAADPEVLSVGSDIRGELFLGESVPFIRADLVQVDLGVTGRGVTVAVLDSGIDMTHQDLVSSIISEGAYHFTDQGQSSGPGAADFHGHGTWISGVIASDGVVSPIGVAPDADILPIRIVTQLPGNTATYATDMLAAVSYVITNRLTYGIKVMNIAGGLIPEFSPYLDCPCDNFHPTLTVLGQAFADAKMVGISTFAATGNKGCTGVFPPACLDATTPVAAVYDADYGPEPDMGTYQSNWGLGFATCFDDPTFADLIACFSNQGNCTMLAAPGVRITGPWLGGGTFEGPGTSPAVAHVSGVAALMLDHIGCAALNPDDIESAMFSTGALTNDLYCQQASVIRVDALASVLGFNTLCLGPADLNCDGRVDFLDLVFIVDCWFGPGIGVGGVCVCADNPDFPTDGDVDLRDFAWYQRNVVPAGACCDFNGPDTCDVMTPVDCAATPGSYLGNGTPCTHCTGACCDFAGVDTCDVMSEADCAATPGTYQGGGTDCSACIPTACVGAQGDCCVAHGTPGCEDEECCAIVCAMDSFCCKRKWDELCAGRAQDNCAICGP